MKKKVLWFSRHEMTPEQRAALGDVEIIQVNKTVQSAYELQDEINECDIIAIVAQLICNSSSLNWLMANRS